MRADKVKAVAGYVVLVAVAGAFLASPLFAEGVSEGQQKLLAKRAAQADAYRQLGELILGLQVSSTTYVRDFVTLSDNIQTSFDEFIKGAKIVGPPRYYDDGACELDVSVTIEQVMQALERISVTYPTAPQEAGFDTSFLQMTQYTRKKQFKATGRGVPRPQRSAARAGSEKTGLYGEPLIPAPTIDVAGWENVTAQGRLLAERAAITDARRNLAERVKGLRITADTYVRDFVVESDQITTELDAFMKGIKQIGPYRYLPDGIVEVKVEVTIQKVIKELTRIREILITRGYTWTDVRLKDITFEEIVDWGPKKTLDALGNGAVPRKGYGKSAGTEAPVSSTGAGSMPAWAGQVVRATGTGVSRSGESGMGALLNAERAAEVDARRKLVELVYGVQIDSTTTVRDFVTTHDEINTEVSAFLAGSQMVGMPKHLEDGSVEVTVELPLENVWKTISKVRDR